jgi:hypothetical protein
MPLEKGLTRRIDWKTILSGMIGFTIGMFAVYVLHQVSSDSPTVMLMAFLWGAIGGASLAIPTKNIKKILLLGVLGGAGIFFGSLLWMFLSGNSYEGFGYALIANWDIEPLAYLLVGLGLGAFLGIYTRKSKSILALSITGGLIFVLVFLFLTRLMPSLIGEQITPGSILVAGALIGGGMGFAWNSFDQPGK